MGMYIIGDSHATFFDQADIMRSHWTGPIHTATIYQLLKKGLNLNTIREDLARSDHFVNIGVFPWQCPSGIYDIPNIKEGDIVFFSFGFNDVQKNVYKYARDNYDNEIYNLINEYLLLLKDYENKFKIKCIPYSIPPNPSPSDPGASGVFSFGANGDFSTEGSSKERNIYTKYANKLLDDLSEKYELDFFNVYDEISDNEGFLKKEYSTDYIHLDCNKDQYIVNKMRSLINKIIEKK